MADPQTETDTERETELSPEAEARLLAAVRRAREDVAAGRVYQTSEEGLRAFLELTERLRTGDPIDDEPAARSGLDEDHAVREAIRLSLERGWLKPA